MRIATLVAAALFSTGAAAPQQPVAPAPQQPPAAAPQQPPPPVPQQPAPAGPTSGVPAPVVTPLAARTFTAKTGMIFQSVRPERVLDFETVIGYLEAALEKTTDPAVRAQAKGWRVFKATEPGPNGTVTYVFVFDPAVPGADYGLGRILADAYPERIQEIWKLYTGALSGGGSLLNLTPVQGPPPVPPEAVPAPGTSGAAARPAPPAGSGTLQPAPAAPARTPN